MYEFYIIPGKEGHWTWSFSGVDLTDSFCSPNHPNSNSSNTDDCGVMVVLPNSFWWEDSSCLTTAAYQNRVPPICERIQSEASCPAGWDKFEGSCYLVVSTPNQLWQEAEKDCISKGGHLASIHSKAEGDFILALVGDSLDRIWLGASDSVEEVQEKYFRMNNRI